MSNGIAHNNLNDISKIYLDTISDINKKEQEDDVKRWQQEEAGCETKPSPFKKKKYKEDWQPVDIVQTAVDTTPDLTPYQTKVIKHFS